MKEIKVDSQLLYEGSILKLYRDKVRLDDGREAVKEVARHNEAVCVLPVEGENIILIRQFRYPTQKEFDEKLHLYLATDLEPRHQYHAAILAVEELACGKRIDGDTAKKLIKRYSNKVTDMVSILEAADSGVLDEKSVVKKILKIDNKGHETLWRYARGLSRIPGKVKELLYALSDLKEYDALLYTLGAVGNCKTYIPAMADKLAKSGEAELADYILARFS